MDKPRRGCSTLWWAPPVREKWLSLLPWVGGSPRAHRGGLWKIRGILLFLLLPSLLLTALPQPITWTSFCKHTQAQEPESHPVPSRAEGGPTPHPRMDLLFPPTPWGSLSHRGHSIAHWPDTLSFPSNHLSQCGYLLSYVNSLRAGSSWLASVSPWHSAWRVNAYHVPGPVLSASCVFIQVSLPMPYMGGSISF